MKINRNKTHFIVQAGVIAALYAVMTHAQNFLLPGSATWAIQMRMSEMLCVLAFFTPAAIPGLSIGCLVFNLTYLNALPIDWLVGTAATLIAAWGMWSTRQLTIKGYPLVGMLMTPVANAVLVGAELTYYFGGGFALNSLYVFLGEAAVLFVAGTILYYAIVRRSLAARLFKAA